MAKMLIKTITEAGKNLIAKNIAGKPITFTRIMAGSGLLEQAQDPKKLTGLIDEKISLNNPEIIDNGSNTVIAQKAFSTADLSLGFLFTELGLAAIDPDTGLEVLFCYNNTGTPQNADYISPSEGSEVIEKVLRIITAVGDAENVNVTIDSSAYVSMDSFIKHIKHPEQHPYTNDSMPRVKNIVESINYLESEKVSKSGDTMTGNLIAPNFIGSLNGNADTASFLKPTNITNVTNILELMPGEYTFDGSNSTKAFGWPVDTTGFTHITLTVIGAVSGSNGYRCLIAAYNNGAHYMRVQSWSTWQPWRQIATQTSPTIIPLTLQNGVTKVRQCHFWKNQFNEVTLHADIRKDNDGIIGGTGFVVATLPVDYRPTIQTSFTAHTTTMGNITYSGSGLVNPDGTVQLWLYHNATTVNFLCHYIV